MSGPRAGAGPAATDGPAARDDAALRRRFLAGERQAVNTLARWIGHPAIPAIMARLHAGAETVVMPIARHLTSQIEVIRFCWNV